MSVYIKLSGGLGNQLFQYATGKYLSLKNSCDLIIDTNWYQSIPAGSTPRSILINQLNINAQYVDSNGKPELLINPPSNNLLKIFFKKKVTKEKSNLTYDPSLLNLNTPIYLDGYWQSYKYFEEIRHILIKEVTPVKICAQYEKFIDTLNDTHNSVMLHIRRGDYVSSPSASMIHGTLKMSYYECAIHNIEKNIKNPIFFVFSDDIDWCRKNLPRNIDVIFIETHQDPASPVDELYLMKMCQHHIIANSSFSWWGAWLCQNQEKIVYAPKTWFANQEHSLEDLIPKNWQLI